MTGDRGQGNTYDLTGSGAEPLAPGDPRRIGGIPMLGRLGAGGMGRVYLGLHQGRYVAVKQVLPLLAEDQGFLRHFGHELDNLSRLPADATARLLASDRTARPPWFATTYVPGLTLNEAVHVHGGGLPTDALWLLLREAASALTSVHALDMVHRDLKPSNVMLTLGGLTLIDFGVARAADQSRLTKTGMIVGTPAYMSPEQALASRQLTGATDVFALGSLIAYAASGTSPFGRGAGLDLLYRIVHDEPDLAPVRDRDPALCEAVASCLDKDPEGRPTAAELAEIAGEHGPFTSPLWPEAVTWRLSERAAFAATVPSADVLEAQEPATTVPSADVLEAQEPATTVPSADMLEAQEPAATLKEPEADEKPGKQDRTKATEPADRPAQRERRRRTRVLVAVVVPVVVAVGTTMTVQQLPYTSSKSDDAYAGPSASPSAIAQVTPLASGTTAPAPAKPGNQGSASPGNDGGATAGSHAGGGDSAKGGSSGSNGSGSAPSSSGGSTEAPSSGSFRLKNAGYGKCLAGGSGSYGVSFGNCTDAPATSWIYKSLSGGTFEVVNEQSGQCMTASVSGYTTMSDCAGNSQQTWRTGSGGTLQSMYNSMCLDESAGWPSAVTCESGKTTQRWVKE
jgi:hypothetical protein